MCLYVCIYIYIHIYTYIYIYIYIYIDSYSSAKPRRATKEGQWVLRGPLHIRTLVFST